MLSLDVDDALVFTTTYEGWQMVKKKHWIMEQMWTDDVLEDKCLFCLNWIH